MTPSLQDPQSLADALITSGHAAEDAGQFDTALDCYRRAIAAAPRYARGYVNLANVLQAQGDYPAVLQALDTAVSVQPDNFAAHFNRGRAASSRSLARGAGGL